MGEHPILTTLGLFIIDENHYPPSSGREPEYDIIGGGGPYAIVGGRIAAGSKLGHCICGIIDKGTDFPAGVERDIAAWNSGAIFRHTPGRLTSRGANIYGDDGVRTFVYKTSKKRIVADDILATEGLLELRSFHLCCSMERCEETIGVFMRERAKRDAGLARPKFVFEPFPAVCVAENLPLLHRMLPLVDVFTPNLDEAASFFQMAELPQTPKDIGALALRFLASSPAGGGVVLRCGALGCFVQTHHLSLMLPAYHQDQAKVVDVTGGGNSFCGAFMTALELSGDWITAAVVGTIASGIVIERLGMPLVDGDVWNGVLFHDRLARYTATHSDVLAGHDLGPFDWF
ncbi:Ribokinase-like protein [Metschnikowia bicuspidata var. bicuspidata NRRL YB-4993]|uniref:Ribokinase-like protein n=1 Tax=Metschnikowia bicuspidata var. bicuspidata NRRL YB-4993 TaxID=869754 RepID=A0A1A0HEZ7_9ASCO|nr:Ribokinase-like protein [Metschnikowia bicuspidata var. bicuspidata NRRL YB-4993]OBA22467.1 Ribokinase-like protein [Metschnikowia bicuspidata var. bicuspidata NRRL YB-4993]